MKKSAIARELIEKYVKIGKGVSKRYLATVLHNEHPEIFKDIESARCIIRYVTNAQGQKYKKNEEIERGFKLLQEPCKEIDLQPYKMPVFADKTLVISDIHSRFYDKKALEIAINDGLKNGCNSVIINGDFMDFYQYSKFDKAPLIINEFLDEQDLGIDILQLLQKTFGFVVLKKGNHDIRRERYIDSITGKVPEFQDLSTYEDYLFYEGSNVQFVKDYNIIEYGDLNIMHGHEIYGAGVHIAYNRLNKTFDNVLSGHSHRPQSAIVKDIRGRIKGSWSIGCLCSLAPKYAPLNQWSHGFAILERSGNDFEVQNKRIENGKLYWI